MTTIEVIAIDIIYKDVIAQVSIPRDLVSDCRELVFSFKDRLSVSDGSAAPIRTPIELHSRFLKYCTIHGKSIAIDILHDFKARFLCGKDIHLVCSELNLDNDQIQTVLNGYFSAWNLEPPSSRSVLPPAVIRSDSAKRMALFGGQGVSRNYFDDISFVYHAYHPLTIDFIKRISTFLNEVASDPRISKFYKYGLDFVAWLENPESIPSLDYLLSSPVSIPLTGVSQLLQYMITFKTLGMTPGELAKSFEVAVGHSHGIVTATVVSCSTTEESFYAASEKALGIKLLMGVFGQTKHPQYLQNNRREQGKNELVNGTPHPMVSIKGLNHKQLSKFVARFNERYRQEHTPVYISVINTPEHFIVSGETLSNIEFVKLIQSEYVSPDQDQSQIPFSKRKPVASVEYTNITMSGHCDIYANTVDKQYQFAIEKGWNFDTEDMQIPVRANDDGHDIRNEVSLSRYLIESNMVLPVNWPVAIDHPGITHIVDFGPGGTSGFGALASRNLEGRGISVICASASVPGNPDFGTRADLYKSDITSVIKAPNWVEQYSPTLVQTEFDGKIHISTKMSRLLGKPLFMITGLSPATVNENLIATIINSGYHIDIACDSIHARSDLESRISSLARLIEPGRGITLDCTYSNSEQWGFQFPAIVKLRKKGAPIEGLTISGSVPSLDVATEIINTIRDAGICHITFKPESVKSIRKVIEIAKASSNFPVILQWGSDYVNGYHSYEDLCRPILNTYRSIRKQKNIVLIANSEVFYDDGLLSCLTGEWSTRFERSTMPFDGVFTRSQMMTTKESKAADTVKKLIADTPGVTTIKTEYGSSMNAITNRCSLFWKELDETLFSVPSKDLLQEIIDKRDYIISHLNSDHTKPWFGTMPDGQTVDIEDMTYLEVVARLVDLLYIKDEEKWIDDSYIQLTNMFLLRIDERFTEYDGSYVSNIIGVNGTFKRIECLSSIHPDIATQLLTSEDVKYFIELCKNIGSVLLPFIPVLDEEFEMWFKNGIVWQSENLSCIFGQDSQRMLILQDPVVDRYSAEVDVSAKAILDGIHNKIVDGLLHRDYDGDDSNVESVGYLAELPIINSSPSNIIIEYASSSERIYTLSENESHLPDNTTWAYTISGNKLNWIYALLTSPFLAEKEVIVNNTICRVLRPRVGHTVQVFYRDEAPVAVMVTDKQDRPAVDIITSDLNTINLSIHHHLDAGSTALQIQYHYNPMNLLSQFSKIDNELTDPGLTFFRESVRLGSFGGYDVPKTIVEGRTSSFYDYYIDPVRFVQYLETTCQSELPFTLHKQGKLLIPADYILVLIFPTLFDCLVNERYCHGALKLVHQSNSIRMIPGSQPLCTGDIISSNSSIVSAINTAFGKQISVKAVVARSGKPVAEIDSSILIRNTYLNSGESFSSSSDPSAMVMLKSEEDVQILKSKVWFVADPDNVHRICPGSTLRFSIKSQDFYKDNSKHYSSISTGDIMLIVDDGSYIRIGTVDYEDNATYSNAVVEYLERFKSRVDEPVYFDGGGYPLFVGSIEKNKFFDAPSSNTLYSLVSGDYVPIHTNIYAADYAGLPSMIVHGMHTSTLTRSFIDHYAADGCPERVVAWNVEFTGMVSPHDSLIPSFDHIGMKSGNMLVKGKTVNQHGNTVLKFTAEIEQPYTAYAFTGQGSQYVGMGMDLYESSSIARDIWDRGDKYMVEKYGVSIFNIVNNNPKQHTVHFNGSTGAQLLRNYIGLVPGITENSEIYTFTSTDGLLHTTQFTQPALALFELAAIMDMRTRGIVQRSAMFAGHSFGEIAALCAIGEVFPLEDMLDIAFCRGILMQRAINIGGTGHSEYGMVAVNPSRVNVGFTDNDLSSVLQVINSNSEGLLELVNFNVKGQQYVVAGIMHQLKALTLAIDRISLETDFTADIIGSAVLDAINRVSEDQKNGRKIILERGKATIPIKNVHVPFHSSLMQTIVEPFRQCIQKKMSGTFINYENLCSLYVPNVTGAPFEISHEYFNEVYTKTDSILIKTILDEWDDADLFCEEKKQHLANVLFVELIANQVACPVQWIATQEYLFSKTGVKRSIEVGPASILSGMAKQSIKSIDINITILSTKDDYDEICYNKADVNLEIQEDSPANTGTDTRSTEPNIKDKSETNDVPSIAQSQPEAVAPSSNNNQSAEPVLDIPLDPCYVIRVIVAQKIGKPLQRVSADDSIKSLVSGKSTLQNEIFGDLKREFGNDVSSAQDSMQISSLAERFTSFPGKPGPHTSALLSRLAKSKFPGGFNKARTHSYLASAFGLGPLRCDGVLLLALTKEPSSRMATEDEAKSWLDRIVVEYATLNAIELHKRSVGGGSSTASGKTLTDADMKALEVAQAGNRNLSARVIEALANSINIDLRKGDRKAEDLLVKNSELQNSYDDLIEELGEEFTNGIKPKFDQLKVRRFDSYWNWARQDLLELFYNLIAGSVDLNSIHIVEKVTMLKNRSTPALVDFLSFCLEQLKKECPDDFADNPQCAFISKLYSECKEAISKSPVYVSHNLPTRPRTIITKALEVVYAEVPDPEIPTYKEYINKVKTEWKDGLPLLYMESNTSYDKLKHDIPLSANYYDSLLAVYSEGVTFSGKCALLTGCGKDSIGEGILKGLLSGGAKVIATTSSYSRRTTLYFEDIYRNYGSRGSELVVVPFNQGSAKDIKSLVQFIYGSSSDGAGLGWELDFVIPFAALPHQFGDISYVGSYHELSLRIMLTSIYRLLGEIANVCSKMRDYTRIAQVLVPLSPNHGQLGNDGLYSESKIGLETLLNRWYNEPWSKYLSVIGTKIGWVRGTSMTNSSDNNNITMEMEKIGVYTFTVDEMAACILSAVCRRLTRNSNIGPLVANISGVFDDSAHMGKMIAQLKGHLSKEAHLKTAIATDNTHDIMVKYGSISTGVNAIPTTECRSNIKSQFPKCKSYDDLDPLHYMQGMVNLDKVVVVTGFGEVGPYGHSKTRWEMEAYGEFSLEGCVELAWVMGYIKFFNGALKSTGKKYTGWVDSKTGEPVDDIDVKSRYEKKILEHTGIRLIEPELHDGYDPNKKFFMRELQIEHDMEPFEASKEEAEHFKLQNDDRVDVWQNEDGTWMVRFLKGAIIMVPKAFQASRTMVAQVPTGWDPVRYGIPEEIANISDPSTCYSFVATVEALLRSGITDPYELYSYFHVSKVGSTVGSGIPSRRSNRISSRHQLMDMDYPKDCMQENLIGIVIAWTNMLLLSSSGPMRPVSGACATSILSIDAAVESIQSGKAEVVFTGGIDDYEYAISYEYGQIGATGNSLDDIAHGRTPAEMSRPCTTTRNGFMESEGAGIAILMSASAAIKMGAPIYGIIALSNTATDKIGRSIPAPGQGILTTARESAQGEQSKMLDFNYRKAKLERHLQLIDQWKDESVDCSETEMCELQEIRKSAQDKWGNEFWKNNNSISPLRGSLSVWGLGADDIGVVSFHGTSTVANDINESNIFNTQFKHIGRTPGNVVPVIAQKWLTGHPKGAAGIWMLNGMLQVFESGFVPGNRNADNIEEKLEEFEYLVFPSKSIQTPGIKAGLLKSFGFGQAGGELLVVHPDYILAALSRDELDQYKKKVKEREKKAYRYWHDTFVGDHLFVQVKDNPPYTESQEQDVYLDPNARTKYNPKTKQYHF